MWLLRLTCCETTDFVKLQVGDTGMQGCRLRCTRVRWAHLNPVPQGHFASPVSSLFLLFLFSVFTRVYSRVPSNKPSNSGAEQMQSKVAALLIMGDISWGWHQALLCSATAVVLWLFGFLLRSCLSTEEFEQMSS